MMSGKIIDGHIDQRVFYRYVFTINICEARDPTEWHERMYKRAYIVLSKTMVLEENSVWRQNIRSASSVYRLACIDISEAIIYFEKKMQKLRNIDVNLEKYENKNSEDGNDATTIFSIDHIPLCSNEEERIDKIMKEGYWTNEILKPILEGEQSPEYD